MRLKKTFRDITIITLGAAFIVLTAATAHAVRVYRSYEIESKEAVMNRRETGVTLLDRHGQVFFVFDESRYKEFIPLHNIPLHVKDAIIAAEDKGFYQHYGISPRGILRALYIDIQKQAVAHGGSTITQQLVKNTYFSSKKSFRRKFHEAILAVKLEQTFTKDDILEMYLNSAYFGSGAFGIEAAALTYFDKHAAELTPAEAALLIGLLPEPSNLSPLNGNPQAAFDRQTYVANQLYAAGYITAPQRASILMEPLTFNEAGRDLNAQAPHFALLVRDRIYQEFGREEAIRAGLRVTTTIDLTWQAYAQQAVTTHVTSLANRSVSNGAAVVIDPLSGDVLALVGSTGWHADQFGKINMAISPRQTGSAIKPIVYAAGLQQRIITPSSIIQDRPRTFGTNYRPVNYNGRFSGPVTVRYALGNSLNIPAVDVANRVGVGRIAQLAQAMGLHSFANVADYNLSIALGAKETSLLDLTSAYGTFANQGQYQPTRLYTSIVDKNQQPVSTAAPRPVQVMSPGVAYQITSILSDNRTRARTFGTALTTEFPTAVKTGTTQTFRDAWTVGYTPNLVVGVWIGNSDMRPMDELAGALGAAPLWKQLITFGATSRPPDSFTTPANLIATRYCGQTEYYLPGTQPTTQRCRITPSPTPEGGNEEESSEEKPKPTEPTQPTPEQIAERSRTREPRPPREPKPPKLPDLPFINDVRAETNEN